MNIHESVGQMMKVRLFEDEEAVNVPAEIEKPEITAELIASLTEQVPELADVDQEEILKGMQAEADEHFDTVGGDMAIIARIALDHIKEFSGKDYYGALDQMEHELSETPEQEEVEHEAGEGTEGPAVEEVPAGEEAPVTEEVPESKKA